MKRYALLVIGLFAMLGVVHARSQDVPRPPLEAGIKLAQDGAFEQALLALDPVVRDLAGKPSQTASLVRAHVYLGVVYVGLEQETAARRHFKEAIDLDPKLQLSAGEFSPRVLRVFEAARKGKNKAVLYGGGLGLGAAAAVAAGLVAGGGALVVDAVAAATPTPTPAPPSATPSPTSIPVPTPPPAAACSLTLVLAPENAGCRIDASANGASLGSASSFRVFAGLPCTARVQLEATNSAGPSATWSNACSGSALGVSCVLNPLGSDRIVGLTCARS